MTVHSIQSPEPPAVIHPALTLQSQIFDAVHTLRELTWDNGVTGNTSHAAEDAEDNAAHKVTALVVELVTLALGIEAAA